MFFVFANERSGKDLTGSERNFDGLRAFDLAAITDWARKSRIVTLTGIPAFVDRGVSVGIDLQGGKPRILINLQAARAEGADFDSGLLKLARIVEREKTLR